MHLPHGGGGQGLLVDGAEDLGQRPAQPGLQGGAELGPRYGGNVGLQRPQLAGHLVADQVRAGGHHLAELHERHPRLRQRPGQPAGDPGGVARPRPGTGAQEAAEPVPGGDADHLGVPPRPALARGQVPDEAHGIGQAARGGEGLQDDEHGEPHRDRPGEQQRREEHGHGERRRHELTALVHHPEAPRDRAEHPVAARAQAGGDEQGAGPADRYAEQPPAHQAQQEGVHDERGPDEQLRHARTPAASTR